MRIAYLIHCNFGDNAERSGVYNKINSQIKYWKAMNNVVKVFQISKENNYTLNNYASWQIFSYNPSSKFDRLIRVWAFVWQEIYNWSPDIVYFRFDPYSPYFAKISSKFPVVVEVNTDDIKEFCLRFGFRCIYNFVTRSLIFKNVAGIIFVSKELSERESFIKFSKPYTVIGNGIDLDLYHPLGLTQCSDINLVFIGSEGQPWHGVDKIIKLAQIKKDWKFHLIGIKQDFHLVNVFSYGPLVRTEYEKIFAQADAGIGSLALHRIGINEISPLKVREYLAYGLPAIVSGKDTDFLESVPFILELPNYENNVIDNIPKIERFVNEWKGKRVDRSDILYLDFKYKENLRMQFFKKIVEDFS